MLSACFADRFSQGNKTKGRGSPDFVQAEKDLDLLHKTSNWDELPVGSFGALGHEELRSRVEFMQGLRAEGAPAPSRRSKEQLLSEYLDMLAKSYGMPVPREQKDGAEEQGGVQVDALVAVLGLLEDLKTDVAGLRKKMTTYEHQVQVATPPGNPPAHKFIRQSPSKAHRARDMETAARLARQMQDHTRAERLEKALAGNKSLSLEEGQDGLSAFMTDG